jgi:hypothetical protein
MGRILVPPLRKGMRMKRIILVLAVAAVMAVMVVASAMPAFAKPSFTPGECNAGGGNEAEEILDGDGKVTGECDPGNSGNTPAVDNDEIKVEPPTCDVVVDPECVPAGND